MHLSKWTLFAALLCIASVVATEKTTKGTLRKIVFEGYDGFCNYDQFRCSNEECISKRLFCDGQNDCGDNSDEKLCDVHRCPDLTFQCYIAYSNVNDRCIPLSWKCDGELDCNSRADEQDCFIDENTLTLSRIIIAKRRAVRWILESRNHESLRNKWGLNVAKKAIAWFLADSVNFQTNTSFVNEMVYEISLGLLSMTSSKKLKDISSLKLATYVNAFLVTCVDPRRFYGMDLVSELRERVDASNETHPSVILALCNADDKISEEDTTKTVKAFWNARRNNRTDVEALAVMALSCSEKQNRSLLAGGDTYKLIREIKNNHNTNGTVENLKNTALVLQVAYEWEEVSVEDNFDEDEALMQILKYQKEDGSFGNMANTYYVLPLLADSNLIKISSSHCTPRNTDESDPLQDLQNTSGHKSNVRFSLWIGNDRTLQNTITLKVTSNTTFYGFMEWAARVNNQFRFEYNMREMKPYIYSISGIQDDPENNTFWFLYVLGSNGDKTTLITQSPSDVIPKNGQHLVFWYKSA